MTDFDDKRPAIAVVDRRMSGPSVPRPRDRYGIVNGSAAFHRLSPIGCVITAEQ